jgi:hypothetical protein
MIYAEQSMMVIPEVASALGNKLASLEQAHRLGTIHTIRMPGTAAMLGFPNRDRIRSLRQVTLQSTMTKSTRANKSDSAKDAQLERFKERIRTLEQQVRALQEENELLYGKLTNHKNV